MYCVTEFRSSPIPSMLSSFINLLFTCCDGVSSTCDFGDVDGVVSNEVYVSGVAFCDCVIKGVSCVCDVVLFMSDICVF